jgi:tetratricopeptide (TPR) repeat protein
MHGLIKLNFHKKMKNISILISITLLVFFSCKNKNTNENQTEKAQRETNTKELSFYNDTSNLDILVLNDKAVQLLQKSQQKNYDLERKDTLLKEALRYLNIAIKKDSNFYNAYLNKSAVYRELGQYNKAAESLKELLSRKKYPEAIFVLGIIYEKQGNQKQGNQKYKEAYEAYQEYMKSPLSTARDEMNKDYVLLFLEGKEKALERINQKLKENPESTSLLTDKKIIEQFNREEFINSF